MEKWTWYSLKGQQWEIFCIKWFLITQPTGQMIRKQGWLMIKARGRISHANCPSKETPFLLTLQYFRLPQFSPGSRLKKREKTRQGKFFIREVTGKRDNLFKEQLSPYEAWLQWWYTCVKSRDIWKRDLCNRHYARVFATLTGPANQKYFHLAFNTDHWCMAYT